jgi:hypothetical protein
MTTVLHEQRETILPDGIVEGDALWMDAAQTETATGWQWKPEGLCHADTCVPVPPARNGDLVRGDRIDIAGMWRHSGQPVVHDSASRAWVLGTGSPYRQAALATLDAPDFGLPDLGGNIARLSHHRGRTVFLATWASW